MKKRVLSLFLAVLMLVSTSIQISAATVENSVSPRWVTMNTVNIDIAFSEDYVGNASVTITKIPGITTSIEADFYVYYLTTRGSWRYLTSTSGSADGSLYLEVEFDAESGVEYRAVAEITAHSESTSESETLEATRTCP